MDIDTLTFNSEVPPGLPVFMVILRRFFLFCPHSFSPFPFPSPHPNPTHTEEVGLTLPESTSSFKFHLQLPHPSPFPAITSLTASVP